MAELMTTNEIQALGQFTCDYPEGKTFEQILELIEQESEEVTIWEPFEYHPAKEVIEVITDAKGALDSTYPKGKK